MSSSAGIRAGDRAFVKVGRNLVEVRVNGRAEGGWNVTSRTGKAMTAKTLLTAQGETLAQHEAEGSEQDTLARTCLTGDDVQVGAERHVQTLDECIVLYREVA